MINMRKFEVGKEYQDYRGKTRKCTKRTDISVWFDGYRKNIEFDKDGNEVITTTIRVNDLKA